MKLRIKNVIHEPRNGFDEEVQDETLAVIGLGGDLQSARKISDWVKAGFEVHVQIERDMENDPVITVREPGGNDGEDFLDGCATRESLIIEKCRKIKDGYISITVRDNKSLEYLTMQEYERNFRKYCKEMEDYDPGKWKYSQGSGRWNLVNHATEYYNDGKILICQEENGDNVLAIRGRI